MMRITGTLIINCRSIKNNRKIIIYDVREREGGRGRRVMNV
jgi:hypothetical protein